ncbi:MAG: ATP-binding cassette domain-containing protein [Granulosicoccus sp.]|nr:ATP-binding cassette domain-containing protein [Granulosicoccus sp.]
MLDVAIDSKTFLSANDQELEAVHGLKFSVAPQSFTCIVGPSGCGKTTTLRIILGLENEFDGTVSLAGNGRTAAVFQEPRLLPWRTVRQNVELCLPEELRSANLDELFEVLGLTTMTEFYPSELSLGLARRAALARAFATEPGLLILDEPFVSLDDDTASRLRNLLMSVWLARPTTALMVTHNLREAAELADTVLILSDRPARLIGEYAIRESRDQRDSGFINNAVRELEALRTSA